MISTSELRRTWAGHTAVEQLCDALDKARARVGELERVHEAATALCAELVCDPVRRDVTWFYDGASALNKVEALHAALDATLTPLRDV